MVSERRRIKLFNRTLQEFVKECGKMLDIRGGYDKSTFENIQLLKTFYEEVNFVKKDYFNCEVECIDNISLFKKFNLGTIMKKPMSLENKKTVWKYFHNLYLTTVEDLSKETDFSENSKKGIEGLKEDSVNIQNIGNGQMGALIQDVSKQLSGKFEGKDLSNINPMNLISSLTGNGESSSLDSMGIDFQGILNDVTKTIQEKIERGELNLEKLTEEAKTLSADHFGSDLFKDKE